MFKKHMQIRFKNIFVFLFKYEIYEAYELLMKLAYKKICLRKKHLKMKNLLNRLTARCLDI